MVNVFAKNEDERQRHNSNLYDVMDRIEEQREALWAAWMRDEGFEDLLRLAIQEVESQKLEHPEMNISVDYQLGRFDGYVEIFEQLYRARQRENTIRKDPGLQTEKAQLILKILYEEDGIRHSELADAVGCTFSSLVEDMKSLLFSGAVEAVRSGRNTCYHLTDEGRRYYRIATRKPTP